ncbi:MAG: bifunctional riboflavin kinase/FAD synthetase [Chloroflexi bacterium]|nr:bifunctional riboflavin kinase/FAD synthetase [Chloroflexota bacterium]
MIHVHSLGELRLQNSWLTIGVFDGVHRGHQQIIQKLTAGAQKVNAPAVVLTFHPHPATVLGRGEVKCLTTPEERAELLSALGVDVVITYPFNQSVAQLTAHEFMAQLKEHLGLKHLLTGYDFALGHGREGNAARLAEIGREMGYEVEVIPAVSDESGVISSTEIRKLVRVGDVAEAGKLLGHFYSLHGPVVHGDHRGRAIGFPTANIQYQIEKVIPANGIYACWLYVGSEKYAAMTNVGVNPTFTPDKRTSNVEAYILDFDRDLYGQEVRLEFVQRLRDEMKFETVDALIKQIQLDVEKGRGILSAK